MRKRSISILPNVCKTNYEITLDSLDTASYDALSDLRVILVSEKHGPVPRAAPLESLPTLTTKHWMYVNKRNSNERSECVYYLWIQPS